MKKTLLLIINLFLVSATNAQTPPCFSARVDYTTAPTVMAVVSADFNGDGNKDLAVANGGANNVSVLLGSATGTFGTPTNFAVGTSPASITFAYINGDSNIDLVVGNFNSNNISILILSTTITEKGVMNSVMHVYPNPSTSALTIQTNEIIESVSIYNSLGSLIQTESKTSFSVEKLSVGIYTLQIKTIKGIGVVRFIKE